MAHDLYERSLCRCGHSSFLAHGIEGNGEYLAKTVTCYACKETAKDSKDLGPGQMRYTVDLHDMPEDFEYDPDEDD